MQISVHDYNLPDDRDFIFNPAETELTMYAYLVDHNFSAIIVKNDSEFTIQVPCNHYMGVVTENEYVHGYIVALEDTILATRIPRREQQRK